MLSLSVALFVIGIRADLPTEPNWTELAGELTGSIVSSTDPGFNGDDFMTFFVFNYPFRSSSRIIFAETDDDVVKSVKFLAKFDEIDFRIRSGANSIGGYSKCDDCVALDLNLMKDIDTIIGADDKPYVTVQPGVNISQFTEWEGDTTQNIHNLMVPHGDCPMVHFGGYCQGGGESNVISQYGWSVEYLLGVRIVLADGELYDVFYSQQILSNLVNDSISDDVESIVDQDLIFALRGGGGGNFGVVTKYYFEPLPLIEEIVFGGATYNVLSDAHILNHLTYYNEFLDAAFTNGDIHTFRVILFILPQVFPSQNATNHLFPYRYGIQYRFYYIDPFDTNSTEMIQDGKDFINSYFDELSLRYGYEPVDAESTQKVVTVVSWYQLHVNIIFPFWVQTGYPETALPTWMVSRYVRSNSIDSSVLQEINDYFWNYILSGKLLTDEIAPLAYWSTFAAPNETIANISLSNRDAQGVVYCLPLALNPTDTTKDKLNELNEEFFTILNKISTTTFMNYVDSYATELTDYYETELLDSLKTVKCNVDQNNLFSYEVGIPCEIPETTDVEIPTTTGDGIPITTDGDIGHREMWSVAVCFGLFFAHVLFI